MKVKNCDSNFETNSVHRCNLVMRGAYIFLLLENILQREWDSS